jgi:hypothetical protein
LNTGTPEYEAGVLSTRPKRSVRKGRRREWGDKKSDGIIETRAEKKEGRESANKCIVLLLFLSLLLS